MGCLILQFNQVHTLHTKNSSGLENDQCFSIHSSSPPMLNINDPIVISDHLTLNPLGFALHKGSLKEFKYLLQEKNASCKSMETLFQKQGKSGIEILIEKGWSDLLMFYLPIVLLDPINSEVLQTPILHKAIALDQLEIVKFVYFYFSFVDPPIAFNFDYIDLKTGENSALVACRKSSFLMIEFLNEQCDVDFGVINYKQQNALQVFISGRKDQDFDRTIWRYLIDKCDIDVVWGYQSILAELEDDEIVDEYIEELKKYEITVKKEEILKSFEDKNKETGAEVTEISCISPIDYNEFTKSLFDVSMFNIAS